MLGTAIDFTTVNAMTNGNANYNDVSPYQNFDGGSMSDVEMGDDFDSLEFSNASGKKRKGLNKALGYVPVVAGVRAIQKNKGKWQRNMEARRKARADRKDRKISIKEQEANTQKALAESIGKEDPESKKLMEQLATDDTKKADETGMSKGLKIGLIVGGVLLVGVIGFVVYKKMKKKK
jgi:hypothetical protein